MKLLFSLIFVFTIHLLAESKYTIVTEHFPPYQIYKNNKLSGISVDIIKEIQKRSRSHFPIKVLPWNKAYTQTLKHKNYIIFSIGRTSAREKQFQWVGPITKLKYVFFKKTSDKKEIRNLYDARKAAGILVSKNDLSHQVLLRLNFTNLKVSKDISSDKNIETLVKSDKNLLWAADHLSGLYKIKRLGLQHQIKATMTHHPLAATTLNIAFNKNADKKLVKEWQRILNEIKKDGTYDKIINRYK